MRFQIPSPALAFLRHYIIVNALPTLVKLGARRGLVRRAQKHTKMLIGRRPHTRRSFIRGREGQTRFGMGR